MSLARSHEAPVLVDLYPEGLDESFPADAIDVGLELLCLELEGGVADASSGAHAICGPVRT